MPRNLIKSSFPVMLRNLKDPNATLFLPPSPPSASSPSYLYKIVMTLIVIPLLQFFGAQILQILKTWIQWLKSFLKNMLRSLCKEILKSLEDADFEEATNNSANEDNSSVFRREAPEDNNVRDSEEAMQGNHADVRGATEANQTTTEAAQPSPNSPENTVGTAAQDDDAQPRELGISIPDEALDTLPFPGLTDLEEQILHLLEEIVSFAIYKLLKVIFN